MCPQCCGGGILIQHKHTQTLTKQHTRRTLEPKKPVVHTNTHAPRKHAPAYGIYLTASYRAVFCASPLVPLSERSERTRARAAFVFIRATMPFHFNVWYKDACDT